MKFSEILCKAGIDADEKARRVANVSNRLASITADEIQDGITIERLESIGVPVFKYATQLTIHGRLPAFSDTARPGGYKSIVRNENGSLGVRYVAIDGAKKLQIVEACRLSDSPQWRANINSQGLEISGFFAEKADCLAAFRSFPRELFAGQVFAAAGMFGGFYVVASVGAVYNSNLWPLINALWNIANPEALAALQAARDAQREADRIQSEAAAAERERGRAELIKKTVANIGLPALRELPRGEGAFVRVGEQGPFLYVLKRKGPALCYQCRRYQSGMRPFEPIGKMKRFDGFKRDAIEKALAAGRVFQV